MENEKVLEEKSKRKRMIESGRAYGLDLRGGEMPSREGNSAAIDFKLSRDVVLNMPWKNMGRGHVDLELGMELPPDIGLDVRSRSGFSNKGMLLNVAFIDKDDNQVGFMTNVRADVDIVLGLVDSDYRDNIGALFRVHTDRYMPTKESKFVLEADYCYHVFYIPKGTRICQGAFRKVENPEAILGELDNTVNRGGGFGHGGAK